MLYKVMLITVLFLASPAWATDWHVNTSSSGSNNGTSWSNAWSFSSISWGSVTAGDTVYFAGGTHTSGSVLSVGSSGTLGNPITIKRATIAEHGSATGWIDSYDAQAILTNSAVFRLIGRSYITFDGVTDQGLLIRPTTCGVAGSGVGF